MADAKKQILTMIDSRLMELYQEVHANKRMLVIDDEEIIGLALSNLFDGEGYNVKVVGSGSEAVEAYKKAKESGGHFAAVIMDLVVPGGMGGKEAVAEIKSIDPDVRAIVSSGYSSDSIMSNYRHYGFSGVISKPYNIAELSRVLSEVTKDA